jgi:hypothetical protein
VVCLLLLVSLDYEPVNQLHYGAHIKTENYASPTKAPSTVRTITQSPTKRIAHLLLCLISFQSPIVTEKAKLGRIDAGVACSIREAQTGVILKVLRGVAVVHQ